MKGLRLLVYGRLNGVKTIAPMVRFLCAGLLNILMFTLAIAQQYNSPLLSVFDSNFKKYTAARQHVDLFVRLDKQMYTPNENIWLAAYVLNLEAVADQHTLHCVLIEEVTRNIVACERFVIDRGIAGGSIFLHDTIRAGEYRLFAYTNAYVNDPEQAVFQQAITIKTPKTPAFSMALLPVQDAFWSDDSLLSFRYKVTTKYKGVASGGEVKYTLQADLETIQAGAVNVDGFGEWGFTVSKREVAGRRLFLLASITRAKEQQMIKTRVPLREHVALVRFFPEGGNLVHHSFTSMGLEVRNGNGLPIAVKGQLLEEGRPVADFITDQYGMGSVKWEPDGRKKYTLQLEASSRQLIYDFPAIAPQGYSLHVPGAIVKDSSLIIEIGVPHQLDTCHLIAHNYREIFYSATLVVKNKRAICPMPTADMPTGIVTLTLFDAAGVPQAERAVLNDKAERFQVQMTTDSVYRTRSKVALKIKILDSKGLPVQSFFSLACVQASRLDAARAVDITRYAMYDRFLPALAVLPAAAYFADRQNIERILLTRFWTRYKWESISQKIEMVDRKETICDAGVVYFKGQPVRERVKLVLLAEGKVHTFETDTAGHFELPASMLKVGAGQKAVILPTGKVDVLQYRILMRNKCSILDTALAVANFPEASLPKADWSFPQQQFLKNSLQAVTVTAKRAPFVYKSHTCKDWVCMNEVLNCPTHPYGTPPVEGGEYYFYANGQMQPGKVIYEDCDQVKIKFLQQVDGVRYPKEFYVADYHTHPPAMPEIGSTIFWSHNTVTDEKGEATLGFFTNDLDGRFQCILQGYSAEGVISGKTSFIVRD